MDSLITAASRALARGDPLGALQRVALRDDAPALALRGIAMAQLGDFARGRTLVRRAARRFGSAEPVASARCRVAEAEIALAARDLGDDPVSLEAAADVLDAHGDRANAAYARCVVIRRLLLLGRLAEASSRLADLDPTTLPPAIEAAHHLLAAGVAIRGLKASLALAALERAEGAASRAGIPALIAEVAAASEMLSRPAGRLISGPHARPLLLTDIETLLASDDVIVDGLRQRVQRGPVNAPLASRPVLFALACALGEASPDDESREKLVRLAFGGKEADESHRARLRVEISRLRRALSTVAEVVATPRGFRLNPELGHEVRVIRPPLDERHASVLALLADGEPWSSSALAVALGASQRTLQRALEDFAARGRVQPFGQGRARRWGIAPAVGTATPLLLPLPTRGD